MLTDGTQLIKVRRPAAWVRPTAWIETRMALTIALRDPAQARG
jgi:hypothetical protein